MFKKYCFDLDGTLCTLADPIDYNTAIPIMERIQVVNTLYDEGHTIIIDTARGSITGIDWKSFTINQLNTWNVKHHILRVGIKLDADYYIDDKGINDKNFFYAKH